MQYLKKKSQWADYADPDTLGFRQPEAFHIFSLIHARVVLDRMIQLSI